MGVSEEDLTTWLPAYRLSASAPARNVSGCCGAWQVIAMRRERVDLSRREEPSDEISYYVTSAEISEHSDAQIHAIVRNHWACIENGVHYRRDVSFGEDACRVAKRKGAHVLASLRNLAIGLYELERERGNTGSEGCKSWSRQLTMSDAVSLLR